jgi:hypothetical protein
MMSGMWCEQEVMKRFKLREDAGADPQTYALGLKEVWEVICRMTNLWSQISLPALKPPLTHEADHKAIL